MIKEIICQNIANPYARRIEFINEEKVLGYLEYSLIYDRIEVDKLYKKFGFREVALRKFYYGDENGILMEKQVM